jgi:adenylate kinase family enzyme
MRRVLVIGCGGAGKTTFSKRLGAALGLEVIHMDAYFWRPGWEEPSTEEWERIVRGLIEQPSWVMDGNYGGTLDLRLAAADTAIFMDAPRTLCLWRVVKRRIKYARKTRPDLAPDCPEMLDLEFLRYIWSYPKERRPKILAKLRDLSKDKRTFVLHGPREARRFLEKVEGGWRS